MIRESGETSRAGRNSHAHSLINIKLCIVLFWPKPWTETESGEALA